MKIRLQRWPNKRSLVFHRIVAIFLAKIGVILVRGSILTTALEGIRILDLTRGPAGGLATMILADFGAEVIVIDGPHEDPLLDLPASPMWRRGKALVSLNLNESDDLNQFHDLCAGSDVLVCNWRPAALEKKNLDFEALHQRHPHLILSHLTGFGGSGPKANYPGYEHIVAAAAGRMQVFEGIVDRPGPVFSALQVGIHACAQSPASGILAALLERGSQGQGRLVETSLIQGMLPYEMGIMIGAQFPEHFSELFAGTDNSEPPMPSLYYHPTQAGDGKWVQFGNLLPHLFDNFLLVTDLMDVVADPDFEPKQLLLLDPEKHEAFRERMLSRIQEKPASEWIDLCIENGGVVATTYQTTQQALHDPDIVANGHILETPDGGLQLGPLARLTKTPGQPGPKARENDDLVQRWQATPRPKPTIQAPTEAPLKGIKVVEIATIIAAPLGCSFLADMGAEVIKIEPVGGDPFRGLLMGLGSARVNAGKRSIGLNLKSEQGKEIILDLVKTADVLIHNFRPGVPERLGIGYEAISAINPKIIYLQSNGYGPDGPGALRPSTHPIPGAAMGGVAYQMGEKLPTQVQDMESLRLWTKRLMRANEVNPDPNTAMVVCTSVMLGLMARQSTGEGQQVLMDMFGANAYANHDDFLSYPGKQPRSIADDLMHGLSATYRLYECDKTEWIFLALVNKNEKEAFFNILSENGIDVAELAKETDELNLAKTLEGIFKAKTASEWENLLAPRGVGCVRADGLPPSQFWIEDDHMQSLKLTNKTNYPNWGDYERHGPNALFSCGVKHLAAAPTGGQHSEEILTEIGFSDDQIVELIQNGVIWKE